LHHVATVRDLVCKLAGARSVEQIGVIVRDVGRLTLGADRVAMWIIDGAIARAAGDDAGTISLSKESHPIAHVILTRRPRWLRSELRAACVLPLAIGDRAIGAVAFTFKNEQLVADERDLVFGLASTITGHVAVAIDRLRTPFGSAARPSEAGSCDRARGSVSELRRWPTGTRPFPMASARRVLIVGEPTEATALAHALEELGHETVVVYSDAAAASVASEWPADVTFVDLDAVHGDPGKLHGQLVALTRQRARVPGFTTHLLKPFELDTVVELLDSLGS
jgi:hypothetical protein